MIDVNSNVQQTIKQFEELLDATQDPEQKTILQGTIDKMKNNLTKLNLSKMNNSKSKVN